MAREVTPTKDEIAKDKFIDERTAKKDAAGLKRKQKAIFLYLGFVIPKGFNYDESGTAALRLKSIDGAKVRAVPALSERIDIYRLKQEPGASRPTFATAAETRTHLRVDPQPLSP